jgi:putative transposase
MSISMPIKRLFKIENRKEIEPVARANRYFVPGYIWHLTHRCHKKEFLLKFSRDRRRWMSWVFQAKKRFGLRILNYIVTYNHIHLLVLDTKKPGVIPKSLQLAAGRIAQEFNIRKDRQGAFWEDRYHATAVESGVHLRNCLTYIDLNMVRAGMVKHPIHWAHSGYFEMVRAPHRGDLVDYSSLLREIGVGTLAELKALRKTLAEEKIAAHKIAREPHWTESVAVGSREFLSEIKKRQGIRTWQRGIETVDDSEALQLRDSGSEENYYLFRGKNATLRPKKGLKAALSQMKLIR